MAMFCIEWYDRLESTNSFLKQRVAAEPQIPSWTVVAAREQTQGRGRMGRRWISGADENLTASFFIRATVDPVQTPSAGMAAALAVACLLESKGIRASLKWPNDVLVRQRKICGILSERLSQGLVIGVGLNVNMERADHIDQPAVSMRMECGHRFDIQALLPELMERLQVQIDRWLEGGFEAIRSDWESRVETLGGPVCVRDGQMDRRGVLAGFGPHGELLLRDHNGRVDPVWAGDLSPES